MGVGALIGGALLGAAASSSSSKSKTVPTGTTSTSSSTTPWKPQEPYLKNLMSEAQSLYNKDKKSGQWAYPGSGISGMVPAQQQGLDSMLGWAQGSQPYIQQALGTSSQLQGANPYASLMGQGQFGNAANTFGEMMNGDAVNQMMNATPNMDVYGPLFDQITKQGGRLFNEQLAPTIRADAMGAGQFGGPKQGQALALAGERVGEQVSSAQERLAQQAASEALAQRGLGAQLKLGAAQSVGGLTRDLSGQEQDAQLKALAMQPQLIGLGGVPGQMQMEAGAFQQAQNQALLSDKINQWYTQKEGPWANLSNFSGAVGQPFGQSTTGSSSGAQTYYYNPAMQMLGGAAMGSGIMGSLFGGGNLFTQGGFF